MTEQTPSPMTSIPTKLIPMDVSQYTAYVGPSWTLSMKVGDAVLTRTSDKLTVEAKGKTVTVASNPERPGWVRVKLPGETVDGTIVPNGAGFSAQTDDGRSVVFKDGGSRLEVRLQGFGAKDSVGIFLKRK
jgi:hypothetical protein